MECHKGFECCSCDQIARTDSHAPHGVHSDFDANHEDMALVNVDLAKFTDFLCAFWVGRTPSSKCDDHLFVGLKLG